MKLLILFIAFVLSAHSLVCKSQIRTARSVGGTENQVTKSQNAIASKDKPESTSLVIYRPGA